MIIYSLKTAWVMESENVMMVTCNTVNCNLGLKFVTWHMLKTQIDIDLDLLKCLLMFA